MKLTDIQVCRVLFNRKPGTVFNWCGRKWMICEYSSGGKRCDSDTAGTIYTGSATRYHLSPGLKMSGKTLEAMNSQDPLDLSIEELIALVEDLPYGDTFTFNDVTWFKCSQGRFINQDGLAAYTEDCAMTLNGIFYGMFCSIKYFLEALEDDKRS